MDTYLDCVLIISLSSGRASSIATILFGSALYTWFKHQEGQHSVQKESPSRRGSYERVKMEDLEAGSAEAKVKA